MTSGKMTDMIGEAEEDGEHTGDEAVRAKAEEFGLKVLSNSQFAALVDEAGLEQDVHDRDALKRLE